MVESEAVYTGFLIFTIAAYAIGSSATNILQLVFVPIQVSKREPVCPGARGIVIVWWFRAEIVL